MTQGRFDEIAAAPILGDKFDLFWSAYPKKKSKGAARKAWAKLKIGGTLFAQIMTALDAQRTWPEWTDIAFVPHPATWLNGERWLDEPSRRVGASFAAPWTCPHAPHCNGRHACHVLQKLGR